MDGHYNLGEETEAHREWTGMGGRTHGWLLRCLPDGTLLCPPLSLDFFILWIFLCLLVDLCNSFITVNITGFLILKKKKNLCRREASKLGFGDSRGTMRSLLDSGRLIRASGALLFLLCGQEVRQDMLGKLEMRVTG